VTERVVFDTSSLIGAILHPESTPDKALQRALEFWEICVSVETLAELSTVLGRDKFDRYADPRQRQSFLESFRRRSRIFVVPPFDFPAPAVACRDPRDNKYLALAFAAEAAAIVSSDDDLLILHPWRGIPILTPAQFLAR
jgi:putative PIN family toxin of toxin-antitoxin system